MNAHSLTETERPALQPLGQWMRTLVDYVRSGKPDLTNRQMALMMTVYIGSGPHTVRGLAEDVLRCLVQQAGFCTPSCAS